MKEDIRFLYDRFYTKEMQPGDQEEFDKAATKADVIALLHEVAIMKAEIQVRYDLLEDHIVRLFDNKKFKHSPR